MAVLTPFVKKGAEEFIGAAGQDGYEKAKTIFVKLKERWSSDEDQEALDVLKNFEKKPERYQLIMEDILQEKLAQDKELFDQLSRLFQEMSPKLEIIQKMAEVEDVTGLKAKKINQGTAKVTQDINQGKNIVGADIDSIG
ncbi:MAG: hypothetical protein NHB32_25090 [Fischerella sp. CENA71]|nr:hypothetical protein [Fischerella sp. CENA71]